MTRDQLARYNSSTIRMPARAIQKQGGVQWRRVDSRGKGNAPGVHGRADLALTEPAIVRGETPVPGGSSRRSLLSRLSIGHVVMILAGLVAILLNLAFLGSKSDTVRVLVAADTLPAGRVLTTADFESVEVSDAGALTAGLITTPGETDLEGAILSRQIAAGEPIRRSDLRPAGTTSRMREYSIELDASRAAGGRISPADVVDVIATIDARSFYVASTVEVVSVSGSDSTLDVGDKLIVVLSVDDRTALELASAEAAGSVAIVRATGAEPPRAGPVVSPAAGS